MGRRPCCDKIGLKQGPWSAEEDKKLINFVLNNENKYQCCWRAVPEHAGLLRCGKSCRLRWTNYLRPDLKRGVLSEHEEKLIIDLHSQLGNKWSRIASHMPGRTDNEIKNLWHTHIKKKLSKMGTNPPTHKPHPSDHLPTDIHQNHDAQPSEESREVNEEDKLQENEGMSLLEESIVTNTDDHPLTERIAMETNDAFSIDEVPIVEPGEIFIPDSDLPFSYSSASSTTDISVSTICSIPDDLDFVPSFEDWLTSDLGQSSGDNMGFLDDDDDFFDWDWLFNVFDIDQIDEVFQSSPDLTVPTQSNNQICSK
ncbi:hypothetical protein ACET3Z_015302 [Daucus carota]